MKTYTIKVTKQDIKVAKTSKKKGCPKAYYCPIAFAVRRRWLSAYIIDLSIYIDGLEPATLTKRARDFVSNFDAGKPVKPFTFRIKL